MRAFQKDGDLVVTDEETIDEAVASGRWIRVMERSEGSTA